MRKEDVQSKLDIIPENLEKLEILRSMSYEEFYNNIDLKTLYQIIQDDLIDIQELYRMLIQIIEEHPE